MASRDAMTAVFGNDQAPHDVFTRSRQEYANAAAAPLQPMKTGYLCPHCGQNVMIFPSRPGYTCQGNSAHHWDDIDSLKALNPKLVPIAQKEAKQAGHVPVTVQIPKDLLDQLNARFGEKLAATLAAVLRNLADPNTLMVPSSDKTQIGVWLGADFANSSQLKGLVFNLFQSRNQTQAELTALRTAVQELDEKGKGYVERRMAEMMKG